LRSVGKSEALRAVIPTTISTTWISVLFAHRVLSSVRVDRFNQKVIITHHRTYPLRTSECKKVLRFFRDLFKFFLKKSLYLQFIQFNIKKNHTKIGV